MKQNVKERIDFTLIDMIRALRGFRSPEGYVVIPNEIAEKIEAEITRLYEVEDTAVELAEQLRSNMPLREERVKPLVIAILGPEKDVTTAVRAGG